eukprot:344750-Pyramimonas_sp.AAC.1
MAHLVRLAHAPEGQSRACCATARLDASLVDLTAMMIQNIFSLWPSMQGAKKLQSLLGHRPKRPRTDEWAATLHWERAPHLRSAD